MKQKLVCLLLALTMAVPLAASAAAKPAETGSPAWSAPCRAFVLENGYRRSGQTWSDKAPAFALHDMDGDGVPELLARNNAPAAADQTAYVYTAAASGLQYAGDAGSYGPADRYAPGSGRPGLYCFNGRSGSYQGTYFTLENGRVTADKVLTVASGPAPDSYTVTQNTKDAVLFAAFAPTTADRVWSAGGAPLTYRTIDEIRSMGWDAFAEASLKADNTLFKDVSLGHWAWTYADYVCAKGIMTGTGKGSFSPGGAISRAQVVTILHRLDNSPGGAAGLEFTDVPRDAWFADAAAWAVNIGLTEAPDGAFLPNQILERQELARMLCLFAQYKKINTPAAVAIFPDWDQVRDDCVEAMYWAVGAGLITGTGDGRLDPTGSLTRAQLAAMLQRFCENVLRK